MNTRSGKMKNAKAWIFLAGLCRYAGFACAAVNVLSLLFVSAGYQRNSLFYFMQIQLMQRLSSDSISNAIGTLMVHTILSLTFGCLAGRVMWFLMDQEEAPVGRLFWTEARNFAVSCLGITALVFSLVLAIDLCFGVTAGRNLGMLILGGETILLLLINRFLGMEQEREQHPCL